MKWFYIFMVVTAIITVISFGFTHNWYAMVWAFYTAVYLFLYGQDEKKIKRLERTIHDLYLKQNPPDDKPKEGHLIGH